MLVVCERIQERNSYRFDILRTQVIDLTLQVGSFEWNIDGSVKYCPFANADAECVGHKRFRASYENVVEFSARLAADHQHVFEALCGKQRRARALSFQQRVGGNSRSVNDFS